MTDQQMLVQLLDRVGAILYDMGAVKARLESGQRQFDQIEAEQAAMKETLTTLLVPLVAKVNEMTPHVDAAKETTEQFDQMKPEFKKMRVVTARFMSVALVSGAIVGAALWALGTIWPFVWGLIKSHVTWS